MSVDRYTYRITWSPDDVEYVGVCLEFPSLSWLSASQEAALKGIRKAVHGVVLDMEEKGETIPTALAEKSYSGKILVRMPPDVHRNLVLQAAEAGVSLNRLVNSKLSQAL